MTSRRYTDTDKGACRYIVEQRGADMKATIDDTLGPLTISIVQRLRLLRLANGALRDTRDGEEIRLAGLGDKTGEDAIRLNVPAIT